MAATEDSLSAQLADETPVQLDPNVDINHINDEDLLRKLVRTFTVTTPLVTTRVTNSTTINFNDSQSNCTAAYL